MFWQRLLYGCVSGFCWIKNSQPTNQPTGRNSSERGLLHCVPCPVPLFCDFVNGVEAESLVARIEDAGPRSSNSIHNINGRNVDINYSSININYFHYKPM
jgi:hypothetical protein